MRKIRIKKTGGPLYDQNTNLSLNQGVNIKKQPKQTVNTTAKEVDRDEANVEAELGEIVFKPSSPQLLKIGGKPHSKGGTHLDLDPSDFIFSKFLKMDEPIAKNFETKKGTSYADAISKDVKPFNEAVHKLATSDDLYEKNAATFTASAIMDKTKQLAFFQELQKGLPQGVPDFVQTDENQEAYAKLGGLMKMQKAGSYSGIPDFIQAQQDEEESELKMGGLPKLQEGNKPLTIEQRQKAERLDKTRTDRNPDHTDYNVDYWVDKILGKKVNAGKAIPGGKWGAREDAKMKELLGKGVTPEELIKKKYNSKDYFDKHKDWYKPIKASEKVQYYVRPEDKKPENNTTPTHTGTTTEKKEDKKPQEDNTLQGDNKIKPKDAEVYDHNPLEVGYGFMDGVGMLSAAMTPINRYAPIRVGSKYVPINPEHVDYTQQRQGIQGQTQAIANQNTLLSPSASVASSRNAALLSQSLNPLAESFANEQNTNVQIDNQFKQYNNQNLNQTEQINNQAYNNYNIATAQMNENFDAAKKFRMNDFLKQWQNAEAKRVAKNAENQLNQDYQVDANGRIIRIVNPDGTLRRITGSTGTSNTTIPTFEEFSQNPRLKGMNAENLQKLYMQQYFGKSNQNFSAGIPEF